MHITAPYSRDLRLSDWHHAALAVLASGKGLAYDEPLSPVTLDVYDVAKNAKPFLVNNNIIYSQEWTRSHSGSEIRNNIAQRTNEYQNIKNIKSRNTKLFLVSRGSCFFFFYFSMDSWLVGCPHAHKFAPIEKKRVCTISKSQIHSCEYEFVFFVLIWILGWPDVRICAYT